jgi:hypothetical protein
VTDLAYLDIRPVLAKVADLERDLVLVGGQAVNFWVSFYEHRVPEFASTAPYISKDIDFCGDQRAVRTCAERLGGKARLSTFDDATPNTGTVVFVDAAGVTRTIDVVSAPFGLNGEEVRRTALPVELLDDAGAPTGTSFYVMHPVLSMESRVHNVVGLAASYDNEQGRRQLGAAIACAREFLRDVLDGVMAAEDPVRMVTKLNERVFRFAMRDRDARELYRSRGVDPAEVILEDRRLAKAFHDKRLPQMRAELATRDRSFHGR